MKLFLSGATGFVGRNFLLHVLSKYGEIFLPIRPSSIEKFRQQLRAENLDPQPENLHILPPDPKDWGKLPADHAVLGAGILFARSRRDYFATNVDWTLAGLQTLPENCRTVVFSSLSAGGPTPAGQFARRETDADAPITWYGESKRAMEQAIRRQFAGRPISILRPPMILGSRDSATLPLFRMAGNFLRFKPGLHSKSYSFLDVDDLVDAILLTLQAQDPLPPGAYYLSAPGPISDAELLSTAAACQSARGWTLPLPQPLIRIASALVDAVPSLRAQVPSLTRDRAKEIWERRWVCDASRFSGLTNWQPRRNLKESLQAACDYYQRTGQL